MSALCYRHFFRLVIDIYNNNSLQTRNVIGGSGRAVRLIASSHCLEPQGCILCLWIKILNLCCSAERYKACVFLLGIKCIHGGGGYHASRLAPCLHRPVTESGAQAKLACLVCTAGLYKRGLHSICTVLPRSRTSFMYAINSSTKLTICASSSTSDAFTLLVYIYNESTVLHRFQGKFCIVIFRGKYISDA